MFDVAQRTVQRHDAGRIAGIRPQNTQPYQAERSKSRAPALQSLAEDYEDDFVYDYVEPGPGETFDFGINYKACGFFKFAAKHGDQDIPPAICGLDFVAYATRRIRLERTQTLAGGASHCNFRFSSLDPK